MKVVSVIVHTLQHSSSHWHNSNLISEFAKLFTTRWLGKHISNHVVSQTVLHEVLTLPGFTCSQIKWFLMSICLNWRNHEIEDSLSWRLQIDYPRRWLLSGTRERYVFSLRSRNCSTPMLLLLQVTVAPLIWKRIQMWISCHWYPRPSPHLNSQHTHQSSTCCNL